MASDAAPFDRDPRHSNPGTGGTHGKGRRRLRWGLLGAVGVLALLAAGVTWSTRLLQGSLPTLDGEKPLPGLVGGPVTVERDANGVPTLTGPDRLSLVRALGYIHGQERFFQMDLLRRNGAGELSALVGPLAVAQDRPHRLHRFRQRAHGALERAAPEDRQVLQAYADGVNAGLAALGHPPLEYTLLHQEPELWRPEDTLLVLAAMAFDLESSNGWDERRLARAGELLGPALAEFLFPQGTSRDAALDGSLLPEPPLPTAKGAPPAVRPTRLPPAGPVPPGESEGAPGSNAFAVDGSLTASGAGMVANDMHLGLMVPNIWFRARLVVKPAGMDAPTLDVVGVTLPGSPNVVTGSNGHIAWGYTNSYIDTGDVVVLQPVDGDDNRYQTPDGPRALSHSRETLCPQPDCPVMDVEDSVWGPVVGRDSQGHKLAYRWQADDVDAGVVGGTLAMERARTVDEAVDVAHHLYIPDQNLVVADDAGHIAWTIVGRVPRRFGHDGRLPVSWADGKAGWAGYLAPGEVPVLRDPPGHRLWTANARVLGGEAYARLGSGGYSEGSRAGQIRDDLKARDRFDERALLQVQLDDAAPFLQYWQTLMLRSLGERAGDGTFSGMMPPVENWGGRAVPASVGYRLVRDFRTAVLNRVYEAYLNPLADEAAAAGDRLYSAQAEGPLRRLLDQRPEGLVPPGYKTWDALIDAALRDVKDNVAQKAGGDLSRFTWGARNLAAIHHPLSHAVPSLAPYLDPPQTVLPGDLFMPRVAAPGFGASERLVVSPGHEAQGLFHMPTGQSGHPLSPYYLAGHNDWLEGRPTPLLPGPTRWRLVLRPPTPGAAAPGANHPPQGGGI